ncbi:MAG: aldo/keto reductase [Clostridia bacterium]|nr:aldo/keto reductase [Clostridia bacterium]
MELSLGTVQFGLDYGICGQKKPSTDYSVRCLELALDSGITAFDTAEAYGNAQEIVGIFLKNKKSVRDKIFLSTKMLPNVLDEYQPNEYKRVIKERLTDSLRVLNTDYADAYIMHSARYAFRPEILEALAAVKEEGLAVKTGVSVYEPEEAKACFESECVDFIQLPYSVFDHRMKEAGVLDYNGSCEIHSRSAFIQGLITMNESEVPPFLAKAKPIVRRIGEISRDTGIDRVTLAMAYVKRENAISHLVFGVDSAEQIEFDIEAFEQKVPSEILEMIENEFCGIDADIVMPSLWKK